MGKRNLPSAPDISYGETDGLPSRVRIFLPKLSRWAVTMQQRLESLLGEVDDDKVTPDLPIELPTLLYSEILAGTRYRAGAAGALVYVPDAPGGGAPAYRNGTAWVLLDSADAAAASVPADLAGTTSTTLADTAGLAVPVTAGVLYAIEGRIRYSATVAATGLKLSLTWPGGAPTFGSFEVEIPALAAGTGRTYAERLGVSGTAITAPSSPSNVGHIAKISGVLKTTSSGVLQVQHASEDGGIMTIREGSYIRAMPIG